MADLRIGSPDDAVVAESGDTGWRLVVRGRVHAAGADEEELHDALRRLAMSEPHLAGDAFAVVTNCPGSWEDEYTEWHGQDALALDDWMERIGTGLRTAVAADGGLYYW